MGHVRFMKTAWARAPHEPLEEILVDWLIDPIGWNAWVDSDGREMSKVSPSFQKEMNRKALVNALASLDHINL